MSTAKIRKQVEILSEMAAVVNLRIRYTVAGELKKDRHPAIEIYNEDGERLYRSKTRKHVIAWIEGYNCCMDELNED